MPGVMLEPWMERLIRLRNFHGLFVSHLFDTPVLNGKADSNMHRCHQTQHEKNQQVLFCILFDFIDLLALFGIYAAMSCCFFG